MNKGLNFSVTFLLVFIASLFSSNLNAQCTDPTPNILGDFSVCGGETLTYSVENYNPTHSYVYSLAGGGTIVSSSDGDVTIAWDLNPGGPYQLSLVESVSSCSGETFESVLIEGDPILVCNDNLNISLADNCEIELTADIILESPSYEDDSYLITAIDENGQSVPMIIGADYIGQTIEVTVTHICSNNKCWGDITIEDKLAPLIECVNDTLTCSEYANFIPTAPTLVADNCDDATFTYTSVEIPQDCASDWSTVLEITWIATDYSGNSSAPCTESIFVEKIGISELSFPLNYDGLPGQKLPLSCSGGFPLNNEGLPDPSFTGVPGGALSCSTIDWTYTDIVLPLCDQTCLYSNSSYKVIRNFVIVDWCTGEILEQAQIIKVQDTEDPVVNPIADITTSVNPFDCSGQVILPIATASDNCTDETSLTYGYASDQGSIIDGILYLDSPAKTMGVGIEITVSASDCCGNTGSETFSIFLVDNTPPVVVADAHEVISLLPNGMATMYATSLDDGSYDNCGPIELFAKRMDNGAGNPSVDLFPPAGNDNSQFNAGVHFFCADIANNPIMVQFQVCDDASMDGIFGGVGDNCNVAMIEVEVQDKYVPVIQCPQDLTISCTEFEGIDLNDESQLDALFGTATAYGTCSVEVSQNVSGTNELDCGNGVIVRTFQAVTEGGTESCTQTIEVNAYQNNLLTCDRINFIDLNNNIYNWCDVNDGVNNGNDDLPAIEIDGCESITVAELNINTSGLCTTAGVQITIDTFNYASSSACKQYIVHYEVIDQCIFDENYVNPNTGQIDPYNSANGYFEFYLEYNVADTEAPILFCDAVAVEAETCEGYGGTISIQAEDACTPEDLLTYEWKIDFNGDGNVDLPFSGWFTGNSVNGSSLGLSAIPTGNHIILWRVDDGCGNQQTCSQGISIDELDKAPTPYCLAGLSTAVMNTNGSVSIWAIDFDNGSEDDCGGAVVITMIPELVAATSNNPHTDSEPSWDFDCDDIPNGVSEVVEIRIYVTDETGAYDYCTATLRIEDNEADFCTDNLTTSTMSGEIKTEDGKGIVDAKVEIMSIQPEFPMYDNTDVDGQYSFEAVLDQDYGLSADKNTNHLNGVSTLDIVIIQKHILGIEILASPYKLIASDVNNDCKVTGLDLVQIRRLLLGKYTDDILPDNQSWRFVNENATFIDNEQPCDYLEEFEIFNFTGISDQNNFVAVKIADVNESSLPGLQDENVETRSDETLKFATPNIDFKSDVVTRIPVYAENMTDVYGFQFGLKMEGVNINGIERGAMNMLRENVGMKRSDDGEVLFSFSSGEALNFDNDEVLFTILVSSTVNDNILNVLSISNKLIVNEAYLGADLRLANVAFDIRGQNVVTELDNAFSLLQNQPNPFSDVTNIRFELPTSGAASLKVFDVQGKLLLAKSGVFSKGYNEIRIEKSEIEVSGELFYQLEFNGEIQTKKMILIK